MRCAKPFRNSVVELSIKQGRQGVLAEQQAFLHNIVYNHDTLKETKNMPESMCGFILLMSFTFWEAWCQFEFRLPLRSDPN